MASSKSPIEHQAPKTNQDLISSLSTVLTDKIIKLLPLRTVAQTSVLSTKWRQIWLSHRYLVFDKDFWDGQRTNGEITWQKISNIISNILFHHNGPIHKFYLNIPHDVDQVISLNLSQWLSFLSKNGIKKIGLDNRYNKITMPSHLFTCKDLKKLQIYYYVLMPPPSSFEGFASLRSLDLCCTRFSPDTFQRLIANCPRITTLNVGMLLSDLLLTTFNNGIFPSDLLIIDVPSLEHLTVSGSIQCFAFKDAPCLKSTSLFLYQSKKSGLDAKTIDRFNFLTASSNALQFLDLGGDLCKLMAAGGITTRFTLAFGHLHTLCMSNLELDDYRVFCFTIGMIQSSPFIKNLYISVSSKTSVTQHQYDCTENYKLGHLRKVEIENFKGSTAELKFVEHLLAISVALDKLFFVCSKFEPSSERKVLRELLELPRLSTKAKVVFKEQ